MLYKTLKSIRFNFFNQPMLVGLFLLGVLISPSLWAKSQVALVFSRQDFCPTKACLHGNFKKNTKVLLLSKEGHKTCSAKVGKKIRVEYEPGHFDANELEGLQKCKIDSKDFFLAFVGRNKGKYITYKSQDFEGEELTKVDSWIKVNKIFSKAWRREVFHKQSDKDKVPYSLQDYKELSPVGFQSDIGKNNELKILRHKFTDGSNEGILFAFYKKKWSAVSSSFTVNSPFVFTLDGRLFITSQVTCQMSCGYIDTEVYEFNGKVFKFIYNNADFST